jgi:hypothetical protein
MTPEERERRRAALLAEWVELAAQELPETARSLDEWEALADRVGKEAPPHVLEEWGQRRQEQAPPSEHACPPCQQQG